MKSSVRTTLQLLPIALQFFATIAAIGLVSFITPITARVIQEAEGKVSVPAPSRLLVEHAGAAKMVLLALFAMSLLSVIAARSKMNDRVDQLIVQGAVVSVVWYVGITLLGGIVMAALLPYFALAAATR